MGVMGLIFSKLSGGGVGRWVFSRSVALPRGKTLHGIGLQLLQVMRGGPTERGGWGPSQNFAWGGRRPDPGLLVPEASRQEAEANSCAPIRDSAKLLFCAKCFGNEGQGRGSPVVQLVAARGLQGACTIL